MNNNENNINNRQQFNDLPPMSSLLTDSTVSQNSVFEPVNEIPNESLNNLHGALEMESRPPQIIISGLPEDIVDQKIEYSHDEIDDIIEKEFQKKTLETSSVTNVQEITNNANLEYRAVKENKQKSIFSELKNNKAIIIIAICSLLLVLFTFLIFILN